MNKFSLVSKKDGKSYRIETKVKNNLEANGWIYDKKDPDLVICVGGDGTLLYAVHLYIDILDKVKFVAIHTGTLGFFTDYTENEVDDCIHDILHGESVDFTSPLLKIDIKGENNQTVYALNEMRIENVIKTHILDIYIDNEYFQTFRGTGMCICTQAGSTAYNRSLKGAVIDSGLELMQMSEITGIHHSQYRSLGVPYIMNPNRTITFKSFTFDTSILCYDHLHISLEHATKVVCTTSDKRVTFARYKSYSYLKRLKNLY